MAGKQVESPAIVGLLDQITAKNNYPNSSRCSGGTSTIHWAKVPSTGDRISSASSRMSSKQYVKLRSYGDDILVFSITGSHYVGIFQRKPLKIIHEILFSHECNTKYGEKFYCFFSDYVSSSAHNVAYFNQHLY